MTDQRFLRNKDLIDQDTLDLITVIGAGGIGSQLIPLLSVMGFTELLVYDSDILEPHNLSTTTFPESVLGQNKAEIAAQVFGWYNGESAQAFPNWRPGDPLSPKVMVGPDDNHVRRAVYDAWTDLREPEVFIDMRMGALALEIQTVTPAHDTYLEDWIAPEAIPPLPCTAKHTIFTGSLAASFGVSQLFNVLMGKLYYQYLWIGLTPLEIEKKHPVIPGAAPREAA